MFNAVVGAILPAVTATDLFAPVNASKGSNLLRSRGFFLDAPGGIGKTFVVRNIQSLLQLRERKDVPVATSAVAASLLEGGQTAHSIFKIPIYSDSEFVCNISLDSALAALIWEADLIIWDEIVMYVRYCVKAVERTIRAIMRACGTLFGGKCIIFSSDFRQILPVVPKGSRGMILQLYLKLATIFSELNLLPLTENVHLRALKEVDNAEPFAIEYPTYLLADGEGTHEQDHDSKIELPPSICLVPPSVDLIDAGFSNLAPSYSYYKWLTSRAILATINSRQKQLNDEIIERFPGSNRVFLSADSVVSDNPAEQKAIELNYHQELLNKIETGSSLPDHDFNL